jgi:hypothetical protein
MGLSSAALVALYVVADVRGLDGAEAPPEIRERFQGRRWSLLELEQRGVRIAGANAWYFSSGSDWQLTVVPA